MAAKGKTYERKVGKVLKDLWPYRLEAGPWFIYKLSTSEEVRYCQPDYILFFEDKVIIVEVKLTLKADSDNKLRNLYRPVVEKALGVKANMLLVARNMSIGVECSHVLFEAVESLRTATPPSFLTAQEIL